MAGSGVTVNGTDLEDFGVVVREAAGRRDAVQFGDSARRVPRSMGRLLPKRRGEAEPRRIDVQGYVDADSVAALRQNLRDLRALLTGGFQRGDPLEVSFADDPTRIFYGRLNRLTPQSLPPTFTATRTRFRMQIVCDDPLKYDDSLSTVDFTAAETDVPLGSGPSAPVITITGSSTDPEIVYRDSDGNVVARFQLSVTLGSGEEAVINMRKHAVEDGFGNNKINDWWTSGDFFEMDGTAHGGGEGGPYPTLDLNGTASSAVAEYRKSWV